MRRNAGLVRTWQPYHPVRLRQSERRCRSGNSGEVQCCLQGGLLPANGEGAVAIGAPPLAGPSSGSSGSSGSNSGGGGGRQGTLALAAAAVAGRLAANAGGDAAAPEGQEEAAAKEVAQAVVAALADAFVAGLAEGSATIAQLQAGPLPPAPVFQAIRLQASSHTDKLLHVWVPHSAIPATTAFVSQPGTAPHRSSRSQAYRCRGA